MCRNIDRIKYAHAQSIDAAGMVRNQPATIDQANVHRTLWGDLINHTQLIAPVITCVVETGTHKALDPNSAIDHASDAALHSIGCSFVILFPRVLMIFMPPSSVHIPMAV